VEHVYRGLLKDFRRVLKQRNSLLRCDRIDAELLKVWDIEFVGLSEQIDFLRKEYLVKLVDIIQWVISETTELKGFEFKYYPGWDAARKLSDVLLSDQQRDLHTKATSHGPQRSDLRVSYNDRPASEVLSRGQIKIIVTAMQVAQGYLYNKITGQQCLYLLDDLPSELDFFHRKKVGNLLLSLGAQTFVTGVIKKDLVDSWPDGDTNISMFHVEQGRIIQE
jgi:DNA replication and repair protein RecF